MTVFDADGNEIGVIDQIEQRRMHGLGGEFQYEFRCVAHSAEQARALTKMMSRTESERPRGKNARMSIPPIPRTVTGFGK